MSSNVFSQTFGGSAVSPSEVAFAAYSFSVDLQFYWPQFAAGQTDVTARFMNLIATTDSLNAFMPDATLVSPGYDVIICNKGTSSFNVVTLNGEAIVTIATGQTFHIIVTDNTTQDGTWQVTQFGVGTGSAVAAALAGAGLEAIAGLLAVNFDATTVSTSYTITTANRAILQVWTGGSGVISLPAASVVGDGFFFPLANNGSGNATITTSGGDLIDGASSSVFSQTQSGFVISSGTGWYTVGKGLQNSFSVTLLNLNVAGNADITESSAQAENIIQQFTGVLTGNINVIVPATVQLYYIFNNTSGAFTLTLKTAAGSGIAVAQGTHSILYCDGTNVINAFTSTFGGAISISPGSANAPNLNFIGSTSTGIYSPSLSQIALTAGGFEVLNAVSVASSVNYLQISATATGNAPIISAAGSDSNIGIILNPKGTGAVGLPLAVILGGTIDATIIGGTTPAAITGTTITGTSLVGPLTGNVTGNLTGNVTGNVSGSSGSTTGNAATATALQTARTIGGVSFDGTSNITVSSATGGFTITGGLILNGSTSGSTTINSGATAGTSVLTLPVATDTLVGKATTDTLTNKTLTSPVISGGTINNAVIGGTTAATGSFTTINSTGVVTVTNTSAGIGTAILNGINASSVANTGVTLFLNPSSNSAKQAGCAAFNDGADNIALDIYTSTASANEIFRAQFPATGGFVVGSPTGTTNAGDVNITGAFKINGVSVIINQAWVTFTGSTGTIVASGGMGPLITGVTRNSAGDYTITSATRADANYGVYPNCLNSETTRPLMGNVKNGTTNTQTSTRVLFYDTSNTPADPTTVYVQIVGN